MKISASERIVGRREGFEYLFPEIDSWLESKSTPGPVSINKKIGRDLFNGPTKDPLHDSDPADLIYHRERRMSFECFNFPSETDQFDQPLEERQLLPFSPRIADKRPDAKSAAPSASSKSDVSKSSSSSSATSKSVFNRTGSAFGRFKTPSSKTNSFDKFRSHSFGNGITDLKAKKSVAALSASPTNASRKTIVKDLKPIGRSLGEPPQEGKKIGIYSPKARKERIERFLKKREQRMWKKSIKYSCRKKLAEDRPRIRGRFVKRKDLEPAKPSAATAVA